MLDKDHHRFDDIEERIVHGGGERGERRTIAKRTEAIFTPRDPNNPPRRSFLSVFEVRVIPSLLVVCLKSGPSSSLFFPEREREPIEKKSVLLKNTGPFFVPLSPYSKTLNNNTLNNTLNIEWKRREEKSSLFRKTNIVFVFVRAQTRFVRRTKTNALSFLSFFLLLFSQKTQNTIFHRQSRLWCCDRLRRRLGFTSIIGACVERTKEVVIIIIIIIIIVRRLWKTTTLRRKKKKDGAVSDSKVSDDERARESSHGTNAAKNDDFNAAKKKHVDTRWEEEGPPPPPLDDNAWSNNNAQMTTTTTTTTRNKNGNLEGVKWQAKHASLLVRIDHSCPNKRSSKIACFDLDETLQKTKSGRKPYATHENDFTFRDASVKDVLNVLHENGYKIVIFSNQGMVKSAVDGKKAGQIRKRLEIFAKEIDGPSLTLRGDAIRRERRQRVSQTERRHVARDAFATRRSVDDTHEHVLRRRRSKSSSRPFRRGRRVRSKLRCGIFRPRTVLRGRVLSTVSREKRRR